MEPTKTAMRKTGRPRSFDRALALEQAMLTFWQHGYETSSISDLTAAMGITAPSLYTAYGDKKQLFLEAMRLYAGSPVDIEQALGEAPTSREAAHRMLIAAAEAFTGELTPRGCLLASATASGSVASTDVQSEVAQVRRDIQARLKNRIDLDIAQRILSAGTDSQTLATMVIAVIQGMSVLARDGTGRPELLAMANVAMNAWPRLEQAQQ